MSEDQHAGGGAGAPSEREKIFERIKEALRVRAPVPGRDHNGSAANTPAGAPAFPVGLREVLPVSGTTFEERLALFRRNATDLKAQFHLTKTPEEAAGLLRELRDKENWKKIAFHPGQLVDRVLELAGSDAGAPSQNHPALALPGLCTDKPYETRELESCSVGLTQCDALIAQTGSVLITSRSGGGRALSVLPPHHVVLASSSQLIADLPEALALLKRKYAPDYPSFISFITGPSRTGDIERILVLGAHGPKRLTIILVQEP
jgi:L-lactate dehydrogenase complex protein LldG